MFESDEEYEEFLVKNVLTTEESAEILDCGRQNISYHIKKGNLKPLKQSRNVTLLSRREVERYKNKRDRD
ncbi:MAG: excisionase family DNA binding protein [Candidatus Frackibacter sp. T328-2]|nr:MAG: excisionase family DNA binding protein [Candidatus Frackibacter sp. T328-2]